MDSTPYGEPQAPPIEGENRHDTVVKVPGTRLEFDDQANDVPQRLTPRWYYAWANWPVPTHANIYPHPLLCGPNGVITAMPNHPHEGECYEPKDLSRTFEFDGKTYEEAIKITHQRLKPFAEKFIREITDEDVQRLLEIRMRRITKHDADSAEQKIVEQNISKYSNSPVFFSGLKYGELKLESGAIDTDLSILKKGKITLVTGLANSKKLVSKTLKYFEEALKEYTFARIHKSYLVNVNAITKYKKGKGGSVIVSNGKEILVSASQKSNLLSYFK